MVVAPAAGTTRGVVGVSLPALYSSSSLGMCGISDIIQLESPYFIIQNDFVFGFEC